MPRESYRVLCSDCETPVRNDQVEWLTIHGTIGKVPRCKECYERMVRNSGKGEGSKGATKVWR